MGQYFTIKRLSRAVLYTHGLLTKVDCYGLFTGDFTGGTAERQGVRRAD